MKGALRKACAVQLLLLATTVAASQEVSTQVWPEIDTFIRLNDSMRIYVPISRTREGLEDSDMDGTVGIYFDYFTFPIASRLLQPGDVSRQRLLRIRAGYSYTAPGPGERATNTLNVEFTGRIPLPWKLLASDRNRFDLNFTAGEFDPRYRNRLRLERDFALGKPTLTAYVYGEVFYSFDRGDWFKTRAAAGVEFHLWERVVPELYFQRDYYKGTAVDINGIGLVVSIYLR